MGRRFEISTIGIDEGLANLSADPFGSTFPAWTGLRVPSFVNEATNRYLFLLATRQMGPRERTRLRGWRQLITIGASVPSGGEVPDVPSRPFEQAVVTPTWRFPDGNVSWHLVREPFYDLPARPRPADTSGFAFQTSDTPALLYQSATWSAGVDPITHAPPFYMLNMTSYVAPTGLPPTWEPIANLGNVHDLRAPWDAARAWDSLDVEIPERCRVSLYATVLQTDPSSPARGTGLSTIPPTQPEETFLNDVGGAIYWRIAGSLIFEDIEDAPNGRTREDAHDRRR
jgi:hypothetical protein